MENVIRNIAYCHPLFKIGKVIFESSQQSWFVINMTFGLKFTVPVTFLLRELPISTLTSNLTMPWPCC